MGTPQVFAITVGDGWEGTLKNLSLRLRNSTMRRDYSVNAFDENRLIISYPLSLL